METITLKCKKCNHRFNVVNPKKVGIYKVVCPECGLENVFRIFPEYKPAGRVAEPMKVITIKCPSCDAMFSARNPLSPGCYGVTCPSCRYKIRVRMKD